MPVLYCPDGQHEQRVGSKRGEKYCPTHGCELRPKPKAQKQAGSKGTAAYDRARRQFNNVVCSNRCFFSDVDDYGNPRREGHVCSYPLDSHHLVPKQHIQANFSDLPADEFLAIIFNPLIGAPLCRRGHDQVTLHHASIYFDELRVECIEYCESVDRQWGDIPTPSGVRRQSMLGRLELESPKREPVNEREVAA